MAPSTSTQPMYAKDERVLCFHGELLYEAKILDSKVKDPNDKKDGYVYRVHYKGWKNTYVPNLSTLIKQAIISALRCFSHMCNSLRFGGQSRTYISQPHADHRFRSWDDWVPQERVRKLTDENRDLASNLRKDLSTQNRATNGKPTKSTKKRRLDSDLTTSTARGSEDRSSAVPPPPPRGNKRGRDIEGIDKVCGSVVAFSSRSVSRKSHSCGILGKHRRRTIPATNFDAPLPNI